MAEKNKIRLFKKVGVITAAMVFGITVVVCSHESGGSVETNDLFTHLEPESAAEWRANSRAYMISDTQANHLDEFRPLSVYRKFISSPNNVARAKKRISDTSVTEKNFEQDGEYKRALDALFREKMYQDYGGGGKANGDDWVIYTEYQDRFAGTFLGSGRNTSLAAGSFPVPEYYRSDMHFPGSNCADTEELFALLRFHEPWLYRSFYIKSGVQEGAELSWYLNGRAGQITVQGVDLKVTSAIREYIEHLGKVCEERAKEANRTWLEKLVTPFI